jgi:hypothetical protein
MAEKNKIYFSLSHGEKLTGEVLTKLAKSTEAHEGNEEGLRLRFFYFTSLTSVSQWSP